jgi:hypothetical protein
VSGLVHRACEHLRRLDGALDRAEQADRAVYLEIITDVYEAPPLYRKLHDNVSSFYNVQ